MSCETTHSVTAVSQESNIAVCAAVTQISSDGDEGAEVCCNRWCKLQQEKEEKGSESTVAGWKEADTGWRQIIKSGSGTERSSNAGGEEGGWRSVEVAAMEAAKKERLQVCAAGQMWEEELERKQGRVG